MPHKPNSPKRVGVSSVGAGVQGQGGGRRPSKPSGVPTLYDKLVTHTKYLIHSTAEMLYSRELLCAQHDSQDK